MFPAAKVLERWDIASFKSVRPSYRHTALQPAAKAKATCKEGSGTHSPIQELKELF